jgi:hypothetical protein
MTQRRKRQTLKSIIRHAMIVHSRVCLIYKCFVSQNRSSLVKAYTTYVRPLVEYSTQVWSPYLIKDILKIESIQRRFTKRLRGLSDLSYKERLTVLGLDTLELRRLRSDLIFTYKIIFGLVDLKVSDFFTLRGCSSTRGHPYKIIPALSRVDARKHFFSLRIVGPWNSLPAHLINFSSLGAFRRSLGHVDLSKFLIL